MFCRLQLSIVHRTVGYTVHRVYWSYVIGSDLEGAIIIAMEVPASRQTADIANIRNNQQSAKANYPSKATAVFCCARLAGISTDFQFSL